MKTMKKQPFRQKKRSMGQVFLTELWPVRRIVQLLQNWGVTNVLEIGPGPGILTKGLLEAEFNVTAVEKDDYLYEQLVEMKEYDRLPNSKLLTLHHEDILKFDFESWLKSRKGKTAIVGNIPYNISSPILITTLSHVHKVVGMVYLTQLEFAMRVTASSNTKSYGSLTVFTQLRAKTNLEGKVDRSCFRPPPKVDSALISITPRPIDIPLQALLKVELVTRSCFMQRRKVLRNALKPFLTPENEPDCPIDLTRRPETLRVDEFVNLAKYFFPEAFEA